MSSISELLFASAVSKQVLMQNHLNENDFDLQENGWAVETYFHIEWFCTKTCFRIERKGKSGMGKLLHAALIKFSQLTRYY